MVLKPQSKRSLLDHSLSTRCFPRILVVNKYFLALARSRSMFRYRMSVRNTTVKYRIISHKYKHSKEVQLGFEQAKRLFVMLDPDYLEVVISGEHPRSEHFNLISLAKGKIGFDCTCEFPPDVLKFFWFRINDFSCYQWMLEYVDHWALNAKKFDRLRVENISTDEHMANVLKQNATHMELSIDTDDDLEINFGDLALTREIRNQTTKSCSLDFSFDCVDQPVSLIEAVANAFQNLEDFSIKTNGLIFYEDDWSVDDFINMLVDYYEIYTKAIAFVQKYAQSGNVEVACDESADLGLELPVDWIENLKERAGFENVEHDTYQYDDYNVTKIWLTQKRGDINSSFSMRFYHTFPNVWSESSDDENDYSDDGLDESMNSGGILDESMKNERK